MEELVKRLRELHPEEFGDAWDFAFACQQAMHEAADAIEELNRRIGRTIELYNRNVEKSAMYEALAGISPEPPTEET